MNQPGFTKFWPAFAETFDELFPPESVPYSYEQFIIDILPEVQKAQVLEFGSGTGRYLLPLASHGIGVWGLDIDAHSLSLFEKRAKDRDLEVKTILQDFLSPDEDTSKLEGKFDIALIAGSTLIMMTPDDQKNLLRYARRVIRKDGAVVVETHNYEHIEQIHGGNSVRQINLGFARGHPVMAEAHWMPEKNIWDLSYQFIRKGLNVQTREISFILPTSEIIKIAKSCGLILSQVTSGWSKNPPQPTAPSLVYLFHPIHQSKPTEEPS